MVTSDDWGSYGREVPKEKHLTGKIFTQRIDRNNLTLRTRIKRQARKTICFSHSVEIHEKSSVPSLNSKCSTDWKHYPALITCRTSNTTGRTPMGRTSHDHQWQVLGAVLRRPMA